MIKSMVQFVYIAFLYHVVTATIECQRSLITSYDKGGSHYFRFLKDFESTQSIDLSIVSIASFSNEIDTTGWTSLRVMSSDKYPDHIQAYWSGFLETNITHELTEASWLNTLADMCVMPLSEECATLQKFLSSNLEYTIKSSIRHSTSDDLWNQIRLQLWQLKGISDAYNNVFVQNSTTFSDEYLLSLKDDVIGIYLLQLSGDLSEILEALKLKNLKKLMTPFGTPMVSRPSCSALIKLIQGDVYLSHVTWSPYSQMLRVLKHYNFPWKRTSGGSEEVPGYAISFSSYPSVTYSVDDFYITSAALVVIETTIGNYNSALWPLVSEQAQNILLAPFRVMAANRLSSNGSQWPTFFKQHNSGTYNNQWMVFDANVYSPNGSLPDRGLLVVAEQLPGIVHDEDVTDVLKRHTYWASYNLPYFPVIYNLSGVRDKAAKYGDWYDYLKTSRSQMFLRDHHKVTDLPSMHRLMRYNNFQHDPLSRCNCTPPYTGENGISARSDLNNPKGSYSLPAFEYRLHGGTDVKITNCSMIHTMNMLATAGPTYDDVQPFDWSRLPVPVPKPRLHPTRWMFEPVLTDFTNYKFDSLHPVLPKVPKLLRIFH